VDPINSVGNICDSRFNHERQGFEAYGNIALASDGGRTSCNAGTQSTQKSALVGMGLRDAFLLDFGLVLRGDWIGPTLGLIAVYNQGSVLVTTVWADPDTVPLRPGDRIIRADGQWIGSDSDWFVILSNLRVGRVTAFEVDRNKQHLQLSVTPSPRSAVRAFIPGLPTLLRIGQMMMLGVACFVAFARPRNTLAQLDDQLVNGSGR
jgi:hypothetical protein